MRRVVITGLGLVSPLGDGVEVSWSNLVSGKSGIRKINSFDVTNLPSKIAGEVPQSLEENPNYFDVLSYVDSKEQRKMGQFIIYAIAAASQALKDSGWMPKTESEKERTGTLIGSGIGGLPEIYNTSLILKEKGARRVSPFFIPAALINLAAGHISIRFGLKGPNHSVVTACASGTHAIGDAMRIIRDNEADVMVAGGTEAAICEIGVAGFSAAKALSTNFNDNPEKASRPWDKERDGFVIGEGSGVLILEEYEHAKARGAKIYGELIGYGLSGDAYHITAPSEDGNGAYRAMKAALSSASLDANSISYINAHGTSTPVGDAVEVKAMKKLFGDLIYNIPVSSTKSSIGHLLGAAGSVEAIFCLLAMRDSILPPTLNLFNPSEGLDLDFVPLKARKKDLSVVMSNSFGFGGTNASVIFKKI